MRRRNATTTTVFLLIAVLALALPASFPHRASAAETVDGWARHTIDASLEGAWGVCVHDIDGDGDPDVVATGGLVGDVSWYEAPDDPTGVWTKHSIAYLSYCNTVYVHDFNGDGNPDVLATGWAADDVVWYEAADDPTGAWTRHTIDANLDGARAVCVHDFDGDGNPDVLAGGGKADDVVWYEAPDNPTGAWTKHTIDANIDYPNFLRVYDIDADGNTDVVATGWSANSVVWYKAPDDPTGAWIKHIIDDNLPGADSVEVHDFDADGNPDVVVTGGNSNEVVWYEAPDNATGVWAKHTIDDSLKGAADVHVYDIDADGHPDVVATGWSADDVVWYEAPDNPRDVWTKHTIDANLDYAHKICIHDIDADGNPDIVACGRHANSVVWYGLAWESYKGGCFPKGDLCDIFDDYATEHTVYVYGAGFRGADCQVIFWEGTTTQRQTDILTAQNAILKSQYTFVAGRDRPGTWYVGVYPVAYSPEYYDADDPNLMRGDTFKVGLSAIECTITFDTYPATTGDITFDGTVYNDGQAAGKGSDSYSIEANPAKGYVFSHWEVRGGVAVASADSRSTTCNATGDGTLKMVQIELPPGESAGLPIWFWVLVSMAVVSLYLGLHLVWRRRATAGREE